MESADTTITIGDQTFIGTAVMLADGTYETKRGYMKPGIVKPYPKAIALMVERDYWRRPIAYSIMQGISASRVQGS